MGKNLETLLGKKLEDYIRMRRSSAIGKGVLTMWGALADAMDAPTMTVSEFMDIPAEEDEPLESTRNRKIGRKSINLLRAALLTDIAHAVTYDAKEKPKSDYESGAVHIGIMNGCAVVLKKPMGVLLSVFDFDTEGMADFILTKYMGDTCVRRDYPKGDQI